MATTNIPTAPTFFNRRDLMKAAPTGILAFAYSQGVAAVREGKTEIISLYREWDRLGDQADATDDDDLREAIVGKRADLEAKMLAMPALSGADIMAKMIAFIRLEGEGFGSDLMMAEARAMVGVN